VVVARMAEAAVRVEVVAAQLRARVAGGRRTRDHKPGEAGEYERVNGAHTGITPPGGLPFQTDQSISFRTIAWIAMRHMSRPKPTRTPSRARSSPPQSPKTALRTSCTLW